MVEPRIIPREAHVVSRRDIDPDALKVLYRLRQAEHVAYLVGGSVLVALVYYVIYRWPLRRTSTLEPSRRASDG